MRPFRSVQMLTIPALAVPLLLSSVVLDGPAMAKGNKTVNCRTVTGTVAGWGLEGCTQPAITGGNSTGIDQPFPTTAGPYTATITWNPLGEAHRGGPPGTTTISVNVSQVRKNKCASGSAEWQLVGSILSNTVSPAVKGKVKVVACVSSSAMVSNTLSNGKLRPAKF